MGTLKDIQSASRAEIQTYLESWGTACYDSEPTELLREAAVENFETEGGGFGPMLSR